MSSASSDSGPPLPVGRIVSFWLSLFFFLSRRCSFLLYAVRPLAVWIVVLVSPEIRRATAANAFRIYGRSLSMPERWAFSRGVVRRFYEFVIDSARCASLPARTLERRIESTDGREDYLALRKAGRGAILVTAHIGNFEIGLVALRTVEPRVHVVFKRDSFSQWERSRSELRKNLGAIEAPIDDGMTTLFKLKAALEANEVVVMQADRTWPGQSSILVPVLHGHLRLPTGPVKLAMLNDSPIVPVLVVHSGPARFRVVIAPAIHLRDHADIESAVRAIGNSLGRFIATVPTQWLVLHAAFVEDQKPNAQH